MRKGLILFVPFLMLLGCSINGLNPNGGGTVDTSVDSATIELELIGARGTITIDELNIVAANFKLVDVLAQTQVTNWTPGTTNYFLFLPVKPGSTTLTFSDVDSMGYTNTTNAVFNVRAGYNYRISYTLGGSIYAVETNASLALAFREMAVYSETHNDTNVFQRGANLFTWNPVTVLTELTNQSAPEGILHWKLTWTPSSTNWVGFGITSTNGLNDSSLYANGHLCFAVRNYNVSNTYKVGLVSVNGVVTNEKWVYLTNIPGYAADGTWKFLSVPMSSFTIDFTKVSAYWEFSSITLNTNTNVVLELDDIYWKRD